MPARESEALVLRTYPFQEADLVVSFVARDQGKLRGVARGARRLKSRFGAGLERLAHVRMFYFQRENRELVNLDSCELIDSQFGVLADYSLGVALDFLAEVSEQLLPEHEPNDRYFRLLLLALDHIREARPGEAERAGAPAQLWPALTYFSLWAVKLGGWLPDLSACVHCGVEMPPAERAFFTRAQPGLTCERCRPANAWALSAESRAIAEEMLHTSLRKMPPRQWDRHAAADLRQFLWQRLEEHLERKLVTVPMLAELE
ncbi:MAG TPA: DNA repair protein RecO [Bryobacterales bacterium]|nr:DNA repair protein RecO [Bryobacterales bacterium]